tara:strand:+ start:729 stop:1136 length:408 start_codon:yes stop_codon:yes gene_type:complete
MIGKKLITSIVTLSDIALIAIYYTLSAIVIVAVLKDIIQPRLEINKRSIKDVESLTLITHVCIEASIIGILAYLLRHFVTVLPSPLNIFYKNKIRPEEISGGFLIGFLAIRGGIMDDFKEKLGELIERLNKKIYS